MSIRLVFRISCLFFFVAMHINAFALSTSTWMVDIYGSHPETRLVDVVIPGTHNSATYNISPRSKLAPAEPCGFKLVKPIVASWSKTQSKDIYEQLIMGIRFLDLRIVWDDGIPMVSHGLISVSLKSVLNQLIRFTDEFPQEVVLLTYTLGHNYSSSLTPEKRVQQNQELTEVVRNHLGYRLMPFTPTVKFSDFWKTNRSIIVLDHHQKLWADSYDINQLWTYLNINNQNKNKDQFSCLQLILTPPSTPRFFVNPRYTVGALFGKSNISALSESLWNVGPSWIQSWNRPDLGYKPNIIISDFFENFPFVDTILKLNVSNTLASGIH